MGDVRREENLTSLGVFAVAFLASIRPIRSWDYFWHLATGRWILDHRALPLHDPFSVASDRVPWINGEWLFQIAIEPLQRTWGHDGPLLAKALLVAATFALIAAVMTRRTGPALAIAVTAVCFYGVSWRLDVRPSTFALLFLVALIVAAGRDTAAFRWKAAAAFLITVLWMNVHPSAVLAPALIAAFALDAVSRGAEQPLRGLSVVLASAAALLVNPFGLAGVTAPLRLAAAVESHSFTNLEWLPSRPQWFPLLYVTMAAAAVLFALRFRQVRRIAPPLLFVLLALMATRSIRHQDLYFAALPLLIAPYLPPVRGRALTLATSAGAVLVALASLTAWPAGLGLERQFPESAVRQLRLTHLPGNIYNADQFGGYLIWSFYPERRVTQDGRNELYGRFLQQYAAARLDGRKWRGLLERYRLTLAVDEYHHERLTVRDPATGGERVAAASELYFPRAQWALIGFDDAAMVFARRDAYPARQLDPWEYRLLVPDAPGRLAGLTGARRSAALAEIERAEKAAGPSAVIARMRDELRR